MVDSITGVLSLKSRITMKEHRLMKATRQTFPAPAATRTKKMKVRQTTRSGQRHANLRRGPSTGVELVGGRSSSPPPPSHPRQKRKRKTHRTAPLPCSSAQPSRRPGSSSGAASPGPRRRSCALPRPPAAAPASPRRPTAHPGTPAAASSHYCTRRPPSLGRVPAPWWRISSSRSPSPFDPPPPRRSTPPRCPPCLPLSLLLVGLPAPDPLCVAPRAAMVVGKLTSLSEKEKIGDLESRASWWPAGKQSRAEQKGP